MQSKIVCFLVFGLSSTLNAGTMGNTTKANPKNSLYAGIGIGGSFNNDSLTTLSFTNSNVVTVKKNTNHISGNLLAGYGYTFPNSFFLGIEANTYFPHRTVNIYSPPASGIDTIYLNQLTIKEYLGLDVLPGYRWNSSLLVYARLGLAFRDVSNNQPENTDSSAPFLNDNNLIGGHVGLGATYALAPHIATAVDYFYTQAPTFNAQWPLYNMEFSEKSHSNYIGISLIYTT